MFELDPPDARVYWRGWEGGGGRGEGKRGRGQPGGLMSSMLNITQNGSDIHHAARNYTASRLLYFALTP